MAKASRPLKIEDYFVRLKTTSVSSDKYADTLEVLYDLFTNEREEALKNNTKILKESLTYQIRLPEHYKFVIGAFGSKN